MRTLLGPAFLALALLVAPPTASARKTKDLTHRYEQVWSAVIRLLRVDMRARIEDQDATNGFVIFDFREGGRSYEGSLELVRAEARGVPIVRVAIQIANAPTYLEAMLLERLQQKLRQDYGDPLVRPVRAADAGVAEVRDSSSDEESSTDSAPAEEDADRGANDDTRSPGSRRGNRAR